MSAAAGPRPRPWVIIGGYPVVFHPRSRRREDERVRAPGPLVRPARTADVRRIREIVAPFAAERVIISKEAVAYSPEGSVTADYLEENLKKLLH